MTVAKLIKELQKYQNQSPKKDETEVVVGPTGTPASRARCTTTANLVADIDLEPFVLIEHE